MPFAGKFCGGPRRQHCWGYISIYENICKKLLHLPPKKVATTSLSGSSKGTVRNIIVTRLWLVLSLHPNTSSPIIYWRKWPNQLAHLELCYRKPDILERMLNWIVLSSSTAGKCTPMQVTQSIIMEGKKTCILHELGNKMQLVVCGALWAPQWKTRGKALGTFTIFSLKLVWYSLLEIMKLKLSACYINKKLLV